MFSNVILRMWLKMGENDVSASIAGYYRQIHEATRELVFLENEEDKVGIECGADVRVFRKEGLKESIEVKFKKDIGIYSSDLYQTMCNFAENSIGDVKLYFRTNTTEKSFKNRNKKEYVIHLLLKYYNKKGNEYIANWYEKNSGCKFAKCKVKSICDNCILDLAAHLSDNPINLKYYIPIFNLMQELEEFSNKIEFQFKGENKLTNFENVQAEIKKQLRSIANKKLKRNLDDEAVENIMHRLNSKFFDTTVLNSLKKGTTDSDYTNAKKVSFKELIEVLKNHERYLNNQEKILLKEYLKVYESLHIERLDIKMLKEKFLKEFKEYEVFRTVESDISENSIKDYLSKVEKWHVNIDERNRQVNRFIKYNKGYGIVAYLMDEDITVIDLYEDKLFVSDYFGNKDKLENNYFYDFTAIKNDIEEVSLYKNDFWKSSELDNFYCLSYQMSQLIQITKVNNVMPASDYLRYNKIDENIVKELNRLVHDKKNILVLKARPHEARNLVNLIVEAIPKNMKKYFLSDDMRNMSNNLNHNTFIRDTLSSSEKELYNQIESLLAILQLDVAIIDLEFVKIIRNEYREFVRRLSKYKDTSIILLENFQVSNLISTKSFEQIKYHYIFEIPEYFDAILVFDSYVVNRREVDEIKLYKK